MDVRLPDGTVVKGVPDGISKAELATKLKANGMNVPDDWMAGPKPTPTGQIPIEGGGASLAGDRGVAPDTRSLGRRALDEAKGVGETALSVGSGLASGVIGPVTGLVAGATGMGDAGRTANSVMDAMTYRPRTDEGQRNIQAISSGLGPLVGAMPELGRLGAVQGMRNAGGLPPPPADGMLKSTARKMMQSALKPTIAAQRTGKAAKAVDTMLEGGYNVSPGGVSSMQVRIADLNQQIAERIQGSGAIVNKDAVASRMQGLLSDFENQVNPNADLASIQRALTEFDNHPLIVGNDIPVELAQKLKQGTYKQLGDKSYGELKSADIEAQKTLARGLKEEIAKAVPEVVPLNAEESKLLNALSVSERRVMMEANKNPVGLGLLTTDPVKMAAWMADRSGLFKSLIARMLNSAGNQLAKIGNLKPLGPQTAIQGAPQTLSTPPQQAQ